MKKLRETIRKGSFSDLLLDLAQTPEGPEWDKKIEELMKFQRTTEFQKLLPPPDRQQELAYRKEEKWRSH